MPQCTTQSMDWMYNNPTGAAGISRDGVMGSKPPGEPGEVLVRVHASGDQEENLLKIQDVKNDGQINGVIVVGKND